VLSSRGVGPCEVSEAFANMHQPGGVHLDRTLISMKPETDAYVFKSSSKLVFVVDIAGYGLLSNVRISHNRTGISPKTV
jgi:hypothetical protein